MESFGSNLQSVLDRKNMTVIELAEKLGVDRQTVYNYLKSDDIGTKKAKMVANILNCDPSELAFGAKKINTKLLAEVIEAVDSVIDVTKVNITKRAELISYLYEEHSSPGQEKLNQQKVKRIVRLVLSE